MKQAIRYFSLGLLLSALLLYGYQFFNQKDPASSLSKDELIDLVENEGYHVLPEKEYIAYSTNKQKNKEEQKDKTAQEENKTNDKSNENKEDKEKEDEKEIKKAKITVKEDTYTPDIADKLVEEEIIDDREEFIEYMDDNDYSESVQLGEFKVNSNMTLKELAKSFTTYPGD